MTDPKRMIVVRGIPGCGKTHWVEKFTDGRPAARCSADHFFLDENGVYTFDSRKIGEAHQQCFRRAVGAVVRRADPLVVIDNTNVSAAECAPYVLLGQSYGYLVEVVTLLCDPVVAAGRNVHGVPLEAIERMAEELAREALPPWWNHRIEHAEAP